MCCLGVDVVVVGEWRVQGRRSDVGKLIGCMRDVALGGSGGCRAALMESGAIGQCGCARVSSCVRTPRRLWVGEGGINVAAGLIAMSPS